MAEAVEASGASVATVALKRVNLSGSDEYANLADFLDPSKYLVLPNTSGAVDAAEAVRIARLGRAAGFGDFVKLEIHPDPNYLLPDPVETLKAAEILAKEGFKVMAYMNADPVLAMRLQDAGGGGPHAAWGSYRHQQGAGDARADRDNHRAGGSARGGGRRNRVAVPRGAGYGNRSRRGIGKYGDSRRLKPR